METERMPGTQMHLDRDNQFPREITFTPYAVRKTGLIRSQAFLKVDEWLLLCVPYKISPAEAVLLVVLNPEELQFFAQFRRRFCTIGLTFKRRGDGRHVSLVLRGGMLEMNPVLRNSNVCACTVSLASVPGGLNEVLGEYARFERSMRNCYRSMAGQAIPLESGNAVLVGCAAAATFLAKGMTSSAILASIAVDSLVVKLRDPLPGLRQGTKCTLRMSFHGNPFVVSGHVTSLMPGDNFGQERIAIALDFSPEIVEIVDDYFLTQSIRAARRAV
jgi:hypothetical protein